MPLYDFKLPIKFYIEEQRVLCSFRINENCVITKPFTLSEFTNIIDNWKTGVSGLETEDAGRIWWEYRDCGPRPDCEPMEFVAINVQGFSFRISVEEMERIESLFRSQT